jgi:hypothetical protein
LNSLSFRQRRVTLVFNDLKLSKCVNSEEMDQAS